jgi:hypothetical protein
MQRQLHWFSARRVGWAVLVAALCVAKMLLFPEYPSSWNRIRDTPGIAVAEVERILLESGAAPDMSAGSGGTHSDGWSLPQPFGTWSVWVYVQNDGARLIGAEAGYYSSLFPWMGRTRRQRLR